MVKTKSVETKVKMCRPCAERLKAEGKVKIGTSCKDKNECANCHRRKSVYGCELINQEPPLIVPIKKNWFYKIIEGVKKEDYREIKNYWTKRFELGKATNKICEVVFKNGYTKNAPTCRCKVNIHKGYGREEWGAEPNTEYYVLDILKVIEVKM